MRTVHVSKSNKGLAKREYERAYDVCMEYFFIFLILILVFFFYLSTNNNF
jgi:hypothetical protein